MPHFDYTITLGALIQAVSFVVCLLIVWTAFKTRTDLILKSHDALLASMTKRFEQHEQSDTAAFASMQVAVTKLVGDMGRVMGQLEATLRRL